LTVLQEEFEGHASRGNLEWVIDEIEPDVIVPVHTTGQGWFRERFENVVVPEEGEKFPLDSGATIRY
jgi:ribonuclease J